MVKQSEYTDEHLITLMVPTYNRLEKLKRCMESIDAQTCSKFNLVISDNASTDGTREYLKSLEGRPHLSINYEVTNFGLIANLEKCLDMAQTPWVIFVTDDDWCAPDMISSMVAILSKAKSAIVAPGFEGRDSDGNLVYSHRLESAYFSPEKSLLEMLGQTGCERIATAGIAGFAMRRCMIDEFLPLKTYPGGFYIDTYLFLGLAMVAGVETVDQMLYTRTEWVGSITNAKSCYANQKKARRLFINDFKEYFLSKSTSWKPGQREAILQALELYEKRTPFTIGNRIRQIGIVRKALQLRKKISLGQNS